MTAMREHIDLLQHLQDGYVQELAPTAHLRATVHQWSQREIDALILALSARRPLLVRGEPGAGKTQLARAAAGWLGWELHSTTIHPGLERSELIYRFDAVKRLADAQTGRDCLVEADYWEPGPLWKALGWESACRFGSLRKRAGAVAPCGHVVLLDEIDKADSDVPNGLLDVLGQWTFEIPQLQLQFGSPRMQLPLIIITTNEERELPAAFIRRCMVLNLERDSSLSYADWLLMRGKAHFRRQELGESVMKLAARRLEKDREHAKQAQLPPPGLAEYIDLLSALCTLAQGNPVEQQRWMLKLNSYAYIKHGRVDGFDSIDQQRPFDDDPSDDADS